MVAGLLTVLCACVLFPPAARPNQIGVPAAVPQYAPPPPPTLNIPQAPVPIKAGVSDRHLTLRPTPGQSLFYTCPVTLGRWPGLDEAVQRSCFSLIAEGF